ncbi:NAD-dependent epimerase/dehydratase family protein, partial [bacterium]|nr:NAD-dependent epimerase/dehydratase family protein [bacterium]
MEGLTVLVTGGAGFIGAHVCEALYAAGITPVVLDDLSMGQRDFV